MTRFDLDMDGSMEPSENGQWVRYEDYLQALEQQKQKRVAFCKVEDVYDNDSLLTQLGVKRGDLLYTNPPKRKPLTDEQFRSIKEKLSRQEGWDGDGWDLALKEAIEAAHDIKK